MSVEANTVLVPIKIQGLPDTACFTDFNDLLRQLTNYLVAEVPLSITNVIISNVQPLDTQRDAVWFRRSIGGTFLGIYLYSEGTWQQFFPVPDQIITVYGDSRTPPEGYITTEDSARLTADQKLHLKATWLQDISANFYTIYTVVPAPA